MSTTTTRNDHLPAITSTLAVVARMNELGISRATLTDMTGHREAINKMAIGMKITTTIANRICQSLDCVYDDLFTTVIGGNHFPYALAKTAGECDGDGEHGANESIDIDSNDSQSTSSPDKSTVKQTEKPRSQSTCAVCGSLSTHFVNVHGHDMCLRCANIPRCADCLKSAYTLYVVAGGDMVCTQCESVRKNGQKEMEVIK